MFSTVFKNIRMLYIYKYFIFVIFLNASALYSQRISDICGISYADRIIGGQSASLGQYPWMARLGYTTLPNNRVNYYLCGGSIINERYILTAAHCGPLILQVKLVKVRVGELNMRTNPDCSWSECGPPVQDIDVERIICHPDFNITGDFMNDICLIRLRQPIVFNKFVRPICLPDGNIFSRSYAGEIMEVAGWGIVNIETGEDTPVLQFVKKPLIPHQRCIDLYLRRLKISRKQICAGGVIGKDSCGGDSGGPLMKLLAINGPPRYYVIGIVSYGPVNCAATRLPGIYTRVTEYMQWIQYYIRQ